jgi:ABC-type transport system substrate-binding protein
LIAALLLLCGAVASAATRPRYGGTLRVEVREAVESLDPPQTGHLGELSGCFTPARWEAGRRAVYTANDAAPGGRPFLDAIEIEMGRPPRERALTLELGKTDMVEAAPAELRRIRRLWSSAPVRLGALVCGARVQDARLREALALSIDRAAIHSVLLQKQGDPSGALLPQWLSGYAFLFLSPQDLARARGLLAGMPAAARAFSLGYDPAEPLARAIAERIALNARDAGLLLAAAPQSAASDIRLAFTRIPSADAAVSLVTVATALGLPEPPRATTPEALHAAERTLLEGFRAIPLFHLPEMWGVAPRVRTWLGPGIGKTGEWMLDNVWLETRP